MYLESSEQNEVKNKNNIDCLSSEISKSEAMTSSALDTIKTVNSNFQADQKLQNSKIEQINNKLINPMLSTSSIESTTITTSLTSSSSFNSTTSSSSTSKLLNNDLNSEQTNNGFSNYTRDRTHLKLDFSKDNLKPHDSFLNGNNNNNNGISPLSLPISLLDSASLLLSPEKILLAAQQTGNNNLSSSNLINQSSFQQQQTQQNLKQQQQQQKLETPTPSTILFPKIVTSEQEKFAEGWQKALQEFQGKDISLSTFQATSPSAVKLLLSLAHTPNSSLSPLSSSINKTTNNCLIQSVSAANSTITTTNNLNNTIETINCLQKHQQQTFDLPKILVNQQQQKQLVVPNNTVLDTSSQSETANNIAKRFMEYFQLGQAAAAIAATSPTTSSIEFNPHNSSQQFHQQQQQRSNNICVSATLQPLLNTQTTSNNNSGGIQKYSSNNSFIKKETNQSTNCDEQMELLIDTQMPNNINGCPLSNSDSNRRSSSISNESSPRINGRINILSNGNTLNGYDGIIGIGEHDMKKLERKRARNRLAASKCRQRKLQRIADLEKQVEDERKRERELQAEVIRLQSVVKSLQEKLTGYQH